jgi:hypothetical protein
MVRARYVAMGVLFRYRRMHQGGQSASLDPLGKPEMFRDWLYGEYGVRIRSEAWSREWAGFVERCFDACDDLDREALAPVSAVIGVMNSPMEADATGGYGTGCTFLI